MTDSTRAAAWDRYAAAALSVLQYRVTGDDTPQLAAKYADALLAERDKRFSPAPIEPIEPIEPKQSTADWSTRQLADADVSSAYHAEREKLAYDRGQCDERERIAKLAEQWAANAGLMSVPNAMKGFAFLLRTPPTDEGKP